MSKARKHDLYLTFNYHLKTIQMERNSNETKNKKAVLLILIALGSGLFGCVAYTKHNAWWLLGIVPVLFIVSLLAVFMFGTDGVPDAEKYFE